MKRAFLLLIVLLQGIILTPTSPIPTKTQEEENYIQYQWQIKPGSNIENIRFKNKNTMPTDSGHWTYLQPLAFQVIEGKQVQVEVDIINKGRNDLGFSVRDYNPNADLIIRCELEKCYGVSSASDGSEDRPFSGTTYYVRTDGGTAGQCIGTTDAPYPGSGTNKPCAWSHPFWALNSSGNWKIQGGDTIIIAAGSYMMGYGAPNTSWCDADGAFECDLPPLPSGPNANTPTRILGKGWNSGCSNPPELWGTQRPWQIIDLTGSSNVYIGCLEITDHSNCVEFHANSAVSCERDTYPYGNWASDGILASDSSNVTLKHLDIHGLASAGIRAGRISNWTVEDVRIAGNGWVGWEGDIDETDSNSGTLTFKRFIVEWNGCGETYPGEQPHNCWAQTAGGYGDGLGTGTTGGHWIFQDSIFRYNTSDGLDLLYTRNTGSQIEIKRTMSYGNAGNPIKVNGPATIENSLMIANCGYFNGKSFTYNVDDCRAGGNSLELSLRKGITVSVVNSTIVGQGDCLVSIECDDDTCNGSETVIIQNNIFQGYKEFGNPSDTACYMWINPYNYYNTRIDYNIVYDVKMGEMTLAAHELNQDPRVVNDSLSSFDGHLESNSPAIDSGLAVGSLSGLIPDDDIESNSRPSGTGVDRGAYEYQGSTPSPTITVTSPNGGESWQAGSSHNITWTSTGSVGNVKIRYSTNNGTNWSTITSSTANEGSYSWTVPNVSSTQCLVKVSETDGSPTDTSNSVFSITSGSTPTPQISLNRTQLNFGAYGNSKTGSQTFLISNSGSGTLNWSASADQSWLSCSPTSGTDSGVVTVSVNPSGLSSGSHTGNITISAANASNSPQSVTVTLTVYTSGGNASPFGSFDTPGNGATVRSSIPVTGWALDDVQVANVKLYRQSNSSQVYIGDAVFVEGARTDVEQAYPTYPLNYKAGWGYMMLTNFLPNGGNGTYTLYAIATDVEENQVTLGSKTITCDNANAVKPFGAIDTPMQGGAASGSSFINWGWVLTPQPNSIPTNGSTINVYVDSVKLGNPTYNIYRSDIAAFFPGYANSNGAAGYFDLDTTTYENGVHTIEWTATDDGGNTDGIGSRYFSVTNSGNREEANHSGSRQEASGNRVSPGISRIPLDSFAPVKVKKGYNDNIKPQIIHPDDSGNIVLEIKQAERVEINFDRAAWGTGHGAGRNYANWRGFLLVGDQLRKLPVGSFLDEEKGIFSWQPGPAHLGEYPLVFIERGISSEMKRMHILLRILPKF